MFTHPQCFNQTVTHPHCFKQTVTHPHCFKQTITHTHCFKQTITHTHCFKQTITHPHCFNQTGRMEGAEKTYISHPIPQPPDPELFPTSLLLLLQQRTPVRILRTYH